MVDTKEQIIVAADVTNQSGNSQDLPSMLEKIKDNTGRYPEELSADAGYFSEPNLKWIKNKVDAYIPGELIKHNQEPEPAPKGRIR